MPKRNEGEGSRSAARDYNKRTRDFVKTGRVGTAAKQAEAAMDTEEVTKLREAEVKGKSEARGEDPQLYKKDEGTNNPKR